jgi:hypothetical protein
VVGVALPAAVLSILSPEKGEQMTVAVQGMILLVSGVSRQGCWASAGRSGGPSGWACSGAAADQRRPGRTGARPPGIPASRVATTRRLDIPELARIVV